MARRKSDPEDQSIVRDAIMARGAAALALLDKARSQLSAAMLLFVEVDDDQKGKKRAALIADAEGKVTMAASAMAEIDTLMTDDWDPQQCEPWDEDAEEVDDEDEDEEDDDAEDEDE